MPGLMKSPGRRKAQTAKLEERWRVDTGDYPTALAWSPDGLILAAATAAGPVVVIDGGSGEVLHSLPGHGFGTLALSWTPNGSLLATAAGNSLRLWHPDGTLHHEFPRCASTIAAIDWDPLGSGRLAAALYQEMRIHDTSDPGSVQSHSWNGSLLSLRWSPAGDHVVCGSQEGSIQTWQMDPVERFEMTGYPAKIKTLSWNRTGSLMASSGAPDCAVWDFSGEGPQGREPSSYPLHADLIADVTFAHADDNLFATGGREGAVAMWRHGRPRPLGAIVRSASVTRLTFRPDDSLLCAGYEDGWVAAYPVIS